MGAIEQRCAHFARFYETIDIDMEASSALREKLNKQLEKEKVRLSVGDLIAKAVAKALQLNPALNATFNGAGTNWSPTPVFTPAGTFARCRFPATAPGATTPPIATTIARFACPMGRAVRASGATTASTT